MMTRHTASGDAPGAERDETPAERADRNWNELLQELRVMQTGAQIMVGFLLTVPFQDRFTDLDAYQRTVYLVLVGTAVAATVLIVAPVGMHRALFARRRKPELVRAADRFAQAGLVCLGLALAGAALLLVDVVLDRTAGWVAGGSALLLAVVAWWVVPRGLVGWERPPRRS